MSVPAALAQAVRRAAGIEVIGGARTSGGSINEAWAVELAGGGRAFVKTRADAAPGEYATEAAGLRWLAEADAVALPRVLAVGDGDAGPRFLALEWIDEGRLDAAGEEALGRGLAALHAAGAADFGRRRRARRPPAAAVAPLRIGELSLPNDPAPDWPSFYARRRLAPLVSLCLRARDAQRARARGRSRPCASGSASSPGRPSRPRACTATCGAAT